MDNKMDYLSILDKARKRKKRNDLTKYIIIAVIVLCAIAAIAVWAHKTGNKDKKVQNDQVATDANAKIQETISEEEKQKEETDRAIEEVIASYQNLGIVQVSGYLNMRSTADANGEIKGKLLGDSACEILESDGEWYKVLSGGIEGYVHSEYVLTGDEAKQKAKDCVKKRAIVKADKLNIRTEPNTDSDVVGQIFENERYEVLSETDGWIQIPAGYISAEFVDVKYALNEGRKLDLKSMVLNLYDNLGISNVDTYLNVREEPKEDGKIIGKMPSKSAGNIVETVDGWYKIKSGPVTGYVKSDFILTGDAAKQKALEDAELMAIVNIDILNARTEPSTDAKIWTQITNSERYNVLSQQDGWVEIELDSTSAFVATEFVDVRYALTEAVKFSPLEEKANAEASLRARICNYALQFLGNPYVWGGTSLTHGADCSGFVLSVMKNFGISLPHYSGSQAQMGKPVKSSEMRPGDLVFYANSSGTINHVGIYIGNGQIVNAASRKSGIKISTWNYRTPVRIRNVID